MKTIRIFFVVFLLFFTSLAFSQEQKITSAVMDLRAEEGVSQSVARTLSDYLRTQLINTDKFIFVTRENVEEVLKEQKFQLSGCTDQECIVEVGKLLGVRKMFTGSVGKVGATYIINLKIIDVESGKIEKAEKEECAKCKEDALLVSVNNIVNKIIPPEDATPYFNRGDNFFNSGKYQEAIDNYTKAIKLNPKFTGAYFNRGYARQKLSQYQEAIADLTKVAELDPKYPNVYYALGWNYCQAEQYQNAVDNYTKAIGSDPKNAKAYNNRGFNYGKIGQYQKAIDDFTKVTALNPKDAEAYNNRGFIYRKLGQYQKAIDDYTRAVNLNPKYANAYFSRAAVYSFKKEKDRALADLKRAIDLDGSFKNEAKINEDFETLWNDPNFKKLTE